MIETASGLSIMEAVSPTTRFSRGSLNSRASPTLLECGSFTMRDLGFRRQEFEWGSLVAFRIRASKIDDSEKLRKMLEVAGVDVPEPDCSHFDEG